MPSLASSVSTASTTDCASMWKKRRAAPRVSAKPKPSAPSEVYAPGTHREIWSGTDRIQSETATNGPSAPDSFRVTYGTRCSSSGWSRLCSSTSTASRRSSFQEVADQTSARTFHSSARIRWASSAHGTATPEAMICAPMEPAEPVDTRWMPLRIPSTSTPAGSAGCWIGSL